jgi:hypothetical protein
MPPPTPGQVRNRERVERVIRLAAPALDLLLTFGDRVSRAIEPQDVEYYPPRLSEPAPPPSRIPPSQASED